MHGCVTVQNHSSFWARKCVIITKRKFIVDNVIRNLTSLDVSSTIMIDVFFRAIHKSVFRLLRAHYTQAVRSVSKFRDTVMAINNGY